MNDGDLRWSFWGSAAGTFVLGLVVSLVLFGLWGCPRYQVWEQGLAGEAELNRASYSRKIAVTEAEAKKESAVMLADAEVSRADGVARANKIIGESLKENEAYLRYLWITGLEHGQEHVIYVPTEANLPILEAGRLGRSGSEKKP